MSYDRIQVANEALSKIRANQIDSFDDGTKAADIMSLHYDTLVAEVFGNYAWTFAKTTKELSRDATYTPLLRYKHAFIVPAELQTLIGVYRPGSDMPYKDYDIEGGRILTNADRLVARYSAYPDEYLWPGYFRAFFATALAAAVCYDITANQTKATELRQQAYGADSLDGRGGLWARAVNTDAMSKPSQEIDASELIWARFGG